ncbi:MAG: hypothetical protein WCX31_04545 [Salinivirgaceae bacterium]
MIQFDFITYMEDVAIKLKDIGHNEFNKRFFRISGIAGLEELIGELPDAQYPALMVVENNEGRISDNLGDNFVDTPSYEFYIVTNYEFADHGARAAAKKQCKTIGQKILAKMLHDSRQRLHGLDLMQFGNIPYFPVGPFGDRAISVYFRFDVNQSSGMVYNAADWEV